MKESTWFARTRNAPFRFVHGKHRRGVRSGATVLAFMWPIWIVQDQTFVGEGPSVGDASSRPDVERRGPPEETAGHNGSVGMGELQ